MSLNWMATPAELRALQTKGMGSTGALITEQVYAGPFPFVDNPAARHEVELASARIYRVTVGVETYATLVLCRGQAAQEWAVYCSDQQVAGGQVADGKTLAAQLRSKFPAVHASIANALEASAWVGLVPDQAACGFFRLQARDRICTHAQAVLGDIEEQDLVAMAEELKSWYSGAELGNSATAAAGEGLSAEEAAVMRAAFLKPVLLAGERGSGKTYLARKLADKLGAVYLEMQMHPSMEPWEFRVHDRASEGKVFQVMGKLAEAVYWVQQGRKVVLCFDEFMNMNPVYQTVINSPLSLTDNDTYLIETGRLIDMGGGLARTETVEVPRDMLWVVATTNVGARYGLDKIAPSVRARFRIVLMNTNADRTRAIVAKNLAKYSMPEQLADMFQKFINGVNKNVGENTLDEEATTRLACDVIRIAYANAVATKKVPKSIKGWVKEIVVHLKDEITQVVNFELGPLDPEQADIYNLLVDSCFKA